MNITSWNYTAERLYGWKKSEVLGKNVFDVFVPKEFQPGPQNIIRTLYNEGIWKGETVNVKKDGSRFPVFISLSIIKDNEGKSCI